MNKKEKRIAYFAAGIIVILLVSIAAAKLSSSEKKAPPVTTTTSMPTETTTPTPTTTTSSTSTMSTTTTTTTTTSISQKTYEYIIPTTFSLPVVGSYTEEIVAYGLSVTKTTFTRVGNITYNGEDIVLMPTGADEVTITPLIISSVTTGAEIKVGNMYGTVPLQLLNFVKYAFTSPTLDNFGVVDGAVTAAYTTEILGEKAIGEYTYSSGAIILVLTFPYSYTLSGVVFNVTGTYTLTYTGVLGTTSEITQTITATTTTPQTTTG